MSLNSLPFNWFDLVVLVILIVGLRQGRKRGMSAELLPLLKWAALVIGCAFIYKPVGSMIAGTPTFGLLSGYLMAYLGGALVIASAFALVKKGLGGSKLVDSDVFGRSEFYLGMLAGMARFSLMLIAALALLNARAFSNAEIQADINYQNDVYGSTYFPKLYAVQAQVFDHSLAGPWIKENFGPLLIESTPPSHKRIRQKDYKFETFD